jgi:hypothetical protein
VLVAALLGGAGTAEAQPQTQTAAPAPPPEAELAAPAQRVDVGALPLFNYNSDLGFGAGLNVGLFGRDDRRRPYAWALSAQGFVSTGGFQRHYVKLDVPDAAGSAFRPILLVGYLADTNRPYYGIGNATSAPPPGDPAYDRHLYAFDLSSLFVQLVVDRKLWGPLRTALLYQFRTLDVGVYPGSVLAADRPLGSQGGIEGQLGLELVWDSRDLEASPTRGWYHTLAGRVAHPALGSDFTYWGGTAIARGYFAPASLGPRLVLAGRLVADLLGGDVPVDELGNFGGRERIEGLGGSWSLRGLPRYRYLGEVKVLSNAELRSRLLRLHPRGRHTLDLWAVGFLDAGRVWARYADDGPTWNVHTGAGGGLRVAWEEDYVVRLDVAASDEGTRGIYLEFNQLF